MCDFDVAKSQRLEEINHVGSWSAQTLGSRLRCFPALRGVKKGGGGLAPKEEKPGGGFAAKKIYI